MDKALYKAIMNGYQMSFNPSVPQQQQAAHENKDTILHIAAKFNRSEIARSIILLEPGFLHKKNAKEDTPLHIAARLGSWETVEVLVNFIKEKEEDLELESDEKLLRMVNARKDTALHDAARNGHYDVVKSLTEVDPRLARMTNDDGESPLFLAVDRRHMNIARHLLNVGPLCSFKGRNGMNVLHAAVIRSQDQGLNVIRTVENNFSQYSWANWFVILWYKHFLKFTCWSLKQRLVLAWPQCPVLWGVQKSIDWEDFIRTLIEKAGNATTETDDFGWTPLHYASHIGANKIAKLFLSNNNLAAYTKTKREGMTLLHVATKEGQVSILETITEHCPEMWDFQDNRGRTPLHTAVESGKLQVVKFIFKIPNFHSLLNQQDLDGNTALHLAIKHQKIFNLLVKDRNVDKTITNKEGFAIFDLAQLKQGMGFFELSRIKGNLASKGCLTSLDCVIYKGGGRPKTPKREQIKTSRGEPENDMKLDGQQPRADSNLESIEEEKHSNEHLKDVANANGLVATLIATVTFAAGFTMPGGYKSDGPNQGMAILSKKAAFGAFVITNTLAFCFSTASVFLYFLSSRVQNRERFSTLTLLTRNLIINAISAMLIAFITGTYAVLSDSPSLDVAVLAIGCLYFLIGCIIFLK